MRDEHGMMFEEDARREAAEALQKKLENPELSYDEVDGKHAANDVAPLENTSSKPTEENVFSLEDASPELVELFKSVEYPSVMENWYYLLLTGKGKLLFQDWDWDGDQQRISDLLVNGDRDETLKYLSHLCKNFKTMVEFESFEIENQPDVAPWEITEADMDRDLVLTSLVGYSLLAPERWMSDAEKAVEALLTSRKELDDYIVKYIKDEK